MENKSHIKSFIERMALLLNMLFYSSDCTNNSIFIALPFWFSRGEK